jgi:hypothetical protein
MSICGCVHVERWGRTEGILEPKGTSMYGVHCTPPWLFLMGYGCPRQSLSTHFLSRE